MANKSKEPNNPLIMLCIATLIGIAAYTSKTLVEDTRANTKEVGEKYFQLSENVNGKFDKVNESLNALTVKVEVLLADRSRGGIGSNIANTNGSSPSPL